MRKEVAYAIAGGIILGLIIAFGVYRVNSNLSKGKKFDVNATPTPKSSGSSELKIVLDKPENDDVVTTNSVTVSGLTKPTTWVTLSGEDTDFTVQSDATGAFSQNVDLVPGVNQIKVTAFENSGAKSATEVLIVYSSSFVERTLPTGSPSDATGTSDIRAKVAQDVANTMSRPKAYIGTVTDVTDSTVQIKTTGSQIEQISVSADGTTVIDSTGSASKTVKTTDIAIGDFIVAMGYVDTNSVLTAQRILVTDAITEPKLSVSFAKVATVTRKTLTVNAVSGGAEDSVSPDVNTDIESVTPGKLTPARFASIVKDDLVIYVISTDSKKVDTVRSIFDLTPSQG